MLKKLKLVLFYAFSISWAKPVYFIAIRHSERFRDMIKNLNDTGFQRAKKLVGTFTGRGHSCLNEFIANNPISELHAHKPTSEKPSTRTADTILPLAQKLKMKINQKPKSEFVKAVRQMKSGPGTKLLSISRGRLPFLLKELNFEDENGHNFSTNHFNSIALIKWDPETKQSTLIYLPQQAMKNDHSLMVFKKPEDLIEFCPKFYKSFITQMR